MPSVEDFLGGATDAADDSGVDIMQNPKAFHDSEEKAKEAPEFDNPEAEFSHLYAQAEGQKSMSRVNEEQRRTYALELAISHTYHQGDVAALLNNAEAISTFLADGVVVPPPTPAAPPERDGTGVEAAQDGPQAPDTQDEDGPREGP